MGLAEVKQYGHAAYDYKTEEEKLGGGQQEALISSARQGELSGVM